MKTTVEDIKILNFFKNHDKRGNLVAIEPLKDIPINISRIFYVYESDGNRGNHAHFKTRQVLICLNGSIIVTCNDGNISRSFNLNSPDIGLYIPEMIWDSISYIDTASILLILADSHYDRSDYIEDFEKFKNIKKPISVV